MTDDLNLLQRLCDSSGISGDEASVREIILSEISTFVADVKVDALGNIIAFKKGAKRTGKKVMISAHMDEVGFIVTHVTDEGLLKFAPVGGIDANAIFGKPVTVGKNAVTGVIGVDKPVHLLKSEERQKSVAIADMHIDIGATDKDQALEYVMPGDGVSFPANFKCENGILKSKALDDRAGCFVLVNLIKRELPFDMYFSFVVQEEVGLRGAKVAAFGIDPDAAIVVEATTAADIKGTVPEKQVCRLSNGAVVAFMDKHTIYDRELYDLALKLAEENNIKVQVKSMVAGGNDAGAIHQSREGVRTIAVSLPCRYLHTACGMICAADIWEAQKLVEKLANKICEA